jgi:hypothetical protein
MSLEGINKACLSYPAPMTRLQVHCSRLSSTKEAYFAGPLIPRLRNPQLLHYARIYTPFSHAPCSHSVSHQDAGTTCGRMMSSGVGDPAVAGLAEPQMDPVLLIDAWARGWIGPCEWYRLSRREPKCSLALTRRGNYGAYGTGRRV